MSIEYKGIKFSTVKELVEYQQLMENKNSTSIKKITTPSPTKSKPKQTRNQKSKYDKHINKIIHLVKNTDHNYKTAIQKIIGKKESYGGIYVQLQKKMGKKQFEKFKHGKEKIDNPFVSPTYAKQRMKFITEVGYKRMKEKGEDKKTAFKKASDKWKTSPHNPYMLKSHPTAPQTFDERMSKLAHKTQTKQISIPKFPTIYPVSNTDELERLFKHYLDRGGNLTPATAEKCLQLQSNKKWDEQTWKEFLQQVTHNIKSITKYFNISPQKIHIGYSGGQLCIQFKKHLWNKQTKL